MAVIPAFTASGLDLANGSHYYQAFLHIPVEYDGDDGSVAGKPFLRSIPPDISLEDYCHYMRRVREVMKE